MRSGEAWLLRNVFLGSRRLDCRIREGAVVEIGSTLTPAGERVLDAHGGALLPGLADHHIHVLALAAAYASIDLGGADSLDAAPAAGLAPNVHASPWLRVIGAGIELSRPDLDRRWPDLPVRVQHRSGRLWTLNSAGVKLLESGLTRRERATGQLWDADERLRTLVGDGAVPDLASVGRLLAASGVTHVTDATPDLDSDTAARIANALPQHVRSMAATGTAPRKLVLSDQRVPDLDGLCQSIAACHLAGRAVAIHTVTAATLALALAAFAEVGTLAGDRLEHAALCDDAAADRIAERGLTVVTQPTIYQRHRTAFLRDTPAAERPLLWRHAGLLARGVRVAVSSDAPYGDAEPAHTIHACLTRPVEGVSAGTALSTMLTPPEDPAGPPRVVKIGAPADLCVLETSLPAALEAATVASRWPVLATFIGGRLIYCQTV
jgi:predicted amidohydrolase YtcJ